MICSKRGIQPSERKRVGRGTGSGTARPPASGTKGQKSRSGPGVRPGFEGGQLPIQRRMPYKRGFTNIYATQWEVVNLDSIAELESRRRRSRPRRLSTSALIRGLEFPVKILGSGEISKAAQVSALTPFRSAREAQIEAAGGTVTVLERTDRWVTARPRNRRLPINRELKAARFGKVGGPRSANDVSERTVRGAALHA